jgi:hypothetical protein
MKLFTGLRKLREFEQGQLPFLKSVSDLDIVIEIGYMEERGEPITLKQLYLRNICSRNTVRRKLVQLIDQGVVIRRKNALDLRASHLVVSAPTIKLLTKYSVTITTISASHFN